MFLFVSKLFGLSLTVSNLLIVAALLGALALRLRKRRIGLVLIWTAALGFVLIGFGPADAILMRPLEDRFPRPVNISEPTGIIVLGGTLNAYISAPRNAIVFNQDGERMSEAAALAHRYPNAMVVFSGGTFGNTDESTSEASFAKRFLMELGVQESRIVLEQRSLGTAENAAFTRALVMPQPGQRWLLVTSASHMPRAVGAFRRAGFPVIGYPVGYTKSGRPQDFFEIRLEPSTGLVRADVALHEWIGLVVYWLTRKTDALFPGPAPITD
jgi:uncharacterized SAM-binding protein YcdF (DUF218 family)